MIKKVLIAAIITLVILQAIVLISATQAQAECTYTITIYQNGKVVKSWTAISNQIKINGKADLEIDKGSSFVYIWKEGLVLESISTIEPSSESNTKPFEKK